MELTYTTSNVARLAGAVGLLVVLAAWGIVTLSVTGELTVSTWAVGLAGMFPVSALLLVMTAERAPPRSGTAYAAGLAASVVVLGVAYLAVALTGPSTLHLLTGLTQPQLVAGATSGALVGGCLALVDAHYVERPQTAALLETQYLDAPLESD